MATKTKRIKPDTRTTQTARPPAADGRYSRRWGSSRECTHQWAANRHPEGSSGNVSFNLGVLKSYAEPIARHVTPAGGGLPVVFVTSRKFSVTTSSHTSDVHGAVALRTAKFDVPNVLADTVAEHRENLASFEWRAVDTVDRAGRARLNGTALMAEAAELVATGNRYAETVGIPDRLAEYDAEKAAEFKAAAAARAEAEARRKERENRAEIKAALKKWEAELATWRTGTGRVYLSNCPDRRHPLFGRTLLRVQKTEGGRPTILETSKGARVPFAAAHPLLAVLRGADLPPGMTVDTFQVDAVDRAAGTITIGCHVIEFAEAERLAAELGL